MIWPYSLKFCDGLNKKCPHRLMSVHACSSVGVAVEKVTVVWLAGWTRCSRV